ncbi:hypothetical protein FOBRF1_010903 [Fusarium oxysporum]
MRAESVFFADNARTKTTKVEATATPWKQQAPAGQHRTFVFAALRCQPLSVALILASPASWGSTLLVLETPMVESCQPPPQTERPTTSTTSRHVQQPSETLKLIYNTGHGLSVVRLL